VPEAKREELFDDPGDVGDVASLISGDENRTRKSTRRGEKEGLYILTLARKRAFTVGKKLGFERQGRAWLPLQVPVFSKGRF